MDGTKIRRVKIFCDKDGNKAYEAIKWAEDHGARWFDNSINPVLKDIAGLFINGSDLTYTKSYVDFQNGPEQDITEQVFGDLKEATAQEFSNSQDAKQDADKPRLTLVPMSIVWDIAQVREFAVTHKYKDPDNWKTVAPERYREAAFRHFLRYLDDPQGVDEESGLPHRWHLETNLAFLAELEGEKHD